jgi:hypothetical protein
VTARARGGERAPDVRPGLEALGLDANSFLRHNSRRIIYGAR